jgi:hypothetical protein
MAERKSGQPLHFYRLSPAAPTPQVNHAHDCVVALRALG